MNFKIEPKASSILDSLRSIGYHLQTALSDIIDNSISANASIIEIVNNDLAEISPKLDWIAIVDNGKGMTIDKMVNAFILGGDGINTLREDLDLGRFGLGLKTASFSQCRKLTVISKASASKIESLVFDLDYIIKNGNKWEAYTLDEVEPVLATVKSRMFQKDIFEKDSWTVVLWENLDKIFIPSLKIFYSELEKVGKHFALFFHKYEKSLEIRLNNSRIEFWNPFHNALSSENKTYNFDSLGNTYSVRTHVLKHNSEFTNLNEYQNQSMIGTFNQNQGFFVYRNNRLIHRGNWLGLFHSEPHYILARVEINLSNSLISDTAWNVDISKSSLVIPPFAIDDLLCECNQVRSAANDIFRYHGGIIRHIIHRNNPINDIQPIWNFESKGNKDGVKDHYLINKDHPLIKDFTNRLSGDKNKKDQFIQVLKYIEGYLPIDNIFARKANQDIEQPKQENNVLYEKFKNIFAIYMEEMDSETAYETLINIEPFNSLSFDEEMLDELGIKYQKK